MAKKIFIAGIGTEVGKTVCSSVVVKALGADYWKPVQAGDFDSSDSITISNLVPEAKVHPEAYRLTSPMSPHAAAKIDDVHIAVDKILPPETDNTIVIEGAGGLFVPLTQEHMIIDLIEQLAAPVLLVSKNYLGSINHTLLSIEACKKRNIEILGIVFNGEPNPETEQVIAEYSKLEVLGRLDFTQNLDKEWVAAMADRILPSLEKSL